MNPRIAIASLFSGLTVAILGVFLESLLRLAFEHNALDEPFYSCSVWLLIGLQWPGLVLDRVGLIGATDFTHSHIMGNDFWLAVIDYVAINAGGWAIVFFCLGLFLSKIVSRRSSS